MFAISNLVLKFEDAIVSLIPFGFTDYMTFSSYALDADFEKIKYIALKRMSQIFDVEILC